MREHSLVLAYLAQFGHIPDLVYEFTRVRYPGKSVVFVLCCGTGPVTNVCNTGVPGRSSCIPRRVTLGNWVQIVGVYDDTPVGSKFTMDWKRDLETRASKLPGVSQTTHAHCTPDIDYEVAVFDEPDLLAFLRSVKKTSDASGVFTKAAWVGLTPKE